MYKPTDEEKQALEQIFGPTVWKDIEENDKLYLETGYVGFTCIDCGKEGHYEYIIDGVPTIVCSDCGKVYYKASTIKLLEQNKSRKNQRY